MLRWIGLAIAAAALVLLGFYEALRSYSEVATAERQAVVVRAIVAVLAKDLEHARTMRGLALQGISGGGGAQTLLAGTWSPDSRGPMALHGPDGSVLFQGPGDPVQPLPRPHPALGGTAGPLVVEGPTFRAIPGASGLSARYREILPLGERGPRGGRAISQTLRVAAVIDTHFPAGILGAGSNAFAMADDGTVLYHPRHPEMVGRNYRRAATSCLACHRDFRLPDRMCTEVEGTGKSSVATGPVALVSFHRSELGGGRWLSLAVSTPQPVALGPFRDAFGFGLLAGFVALALSLASVWQVELQRRLLDRTNVEAAAWRDRAALLDQVERAKRDWETAFDAVDDLVVLIDGEAKVARANRAFCRRLGLEPRDVVGAPVRSVFERLKGPWPVTDHLEICRATPDLGLEVADPGLRETFLVSVSPTPGIAGSPGCVMIARSITEQKRLREQMLQAEKLAAVGELVAGVAHELNNPLSVVVGYAELAQQEQPGKGLHEMLDKIQRSAFRCRRVVENLLRFARRYPPAIVPIRLNDVIEETLALLEYELRVANIEVRRELSAFVPPVMADPHQLQQVLLNLFTNALHAISGERKPGRISVKTSWQAGGPALIEISDTGPGVPQGDLETIFESFYSTKAVGQGTGLGLTVSRRIIQEQRGRIWATSPPGAGATFWIELPLSDATGPARAPEGTDSTDKGPTGQRVLVLDDEPENLQLMAMILRRRGYTVDTARGGQEALGKILAGSFAAVVSDVRMPGVSGLQLYREVQRLKPGYERHILFVTGDSVTGTTRAELERTGNPWIEKPFDAKELLAALELLLDRSHGPC